MNRRRCYLIVQSVLVLALAGLLIVYTVTIYQEGVARKADNVLENVFRPDDVAGKLSAAGPLAFLLIAMSAAGLVLNIEDERAKRPVKDAKVTRDLVVSRIAKPSPDMEKERRRQKGIGILGWMVFFMCMVPIGIYLTKEEHFRLDDLERMIRFLTLTAFPWAGAGILALWTSFVLVQKSQMKETELAKERLAEEKEEGLAAPGKSVKKERSYILLQLTVLAAAVIFIVAGVVNRSAMDVFVKAARICTECIGLG